MASQVLNRPDWPGEPSRAGELFRLHTNKCGQQLEAVCQLITTQLGWELRLELAGSRERSAVCRSQEEALDASEAWKAAMVGKGWR
jgi:hypothetical protein